MRFRSIGRHDDLLQSVALVWPCGVPAFPALGDTAALVRLASCACGRLVAALPAPRLRCEPRRGTLEQEITATTLVIAIVAPRGEKWIHAAPQGIDRAYVGAGRRQHGIEFMNSATNSNSMFGPLGRSMGGVRPRMRSKIQRPIDLEWSRSLANVKNHMFDIW